MRLKALKALQNRAAVSGVPLRHSDAVCLRHPSSTVLAIDLFQRVFGRLCVTMCIAELIFSWSTTPINSKGYFDRAGRAVPREASSSCDSAGREPRPVEVVA